jgi:CxxC motif-containing protein
MVKRKRKKFICIICPKCCELEIDGSEVSGARCKKGEEFARQEVILPLRVITTTIRCETKEGTKIIPVKTASPVPLSQITGIMQHIKRVRLSEVPTIGSAITVTENSEPIELIITGE